MNLGRAIKLCRTQQGLSQAELSERSGISVSYLSLVEREKRDPSFSTVQNIASALDVPLSILVFLASERHELSSLSDGLLEKLSDTSLRLIEASANASTGV